MALMADNIYYLVMADPLSHTVGGIQINISTIGIINEMLLYSNDGIIEALPAILAMERSKSKVYVQEQMQKFPLNGQPKP